MSAKIFIDGLCCVKNNEVKTNPLVLEGAGFADKYEYASRHSLCKIHHLRVLHNIHCQTSNTTCMSGAEEVKKFVTTRNTSSGHWARRTGPEYTARRVLFQIYSCTMYTALLHPRTAPPVTCWQPSCEDTCAIVTPRYYVTFRHVAKLCDCNEKW